MLITTREVMGEIEKRYNGKRDEVILDCTDSDPKFFFELCSRPWAHITKIERVTS